MDKSTAAAESELALEHGRNEPQELEGEHQPSNAVCSLLNLAIFSRFTDIYYYYYTEFNVPHVSHN